MSKANTTKGSEAFEATYRRLFGDRWDALRATLVRQRDPVPFSDGLLQPYYLDEASLIAARSLPVSAGDRVLDLCAAPGGKSLVLASALHGTGSLTANDRSRERRFRLADVLKEHLPPAWLATVTVTGHDAATWGLHEQEAYDRILLDAPCSSERHVIVDPQALAQWSPARPRHLAAQQFAMLCAALEAVKVGGMILYSTCALHPAEDEDIIARLAKKREGRFSVIPCPHPLAEQRPYGQIILPDAADGKGPLYYCLLRRDA